MDRPNQIDELAKPFHVKNLISNTGTLSEIYGSWSNAKFLWEIYKYIGNTAESTHPTRYSLQRNG